MENIANGVAQSASAPPANAQEYLVALDLGTNSVLLLTAVRDGRNHIIPLDEQIRMPRLGEEVARNGALKHEAIDRTLDAVADVLGTLEDTPLPGCAVAAATSAVREADNSQEFLEKFYRRFEAQPHLITGPEEARTVFLGVASDQPRSLELLSLDIGGGSTEYGIGVKNRCIRAESLPVGCVHLTEAFDLHEPVSKEKLQDVRTYTKRHMNPLWEHYRQHTHHFPRLIVSGGTATTYAAHELGTAEYCHDQIHGFIGTRSDVEQFLEQLRLMSMEERASQAAISEERAPLLPAGLMILLTALDMTDTETFYISCRGLRYGLLERLQHQDLAPTWEW